MIQSISSGAPAAAAGVTGSPKVRQPEGKPQERTRQPVMDEYVPEEKREPTGRYWLEKDENGLPKVCFDDPERKAAGGKEAETCTASTDQVDREIERLKEKKEQLGQRIRSETDEAKRQELEAELARVEGELSRKDNDAYRRRHTVFS